MDCKQADTFFMKYAENTIKPDDAKNLAKHLLICKGCRESFVVFDTCLDESSIVEAPDDFTQNVMTRIIEAKSSKFVWVRAFVGFAAIAVGVLLFALLNFGYQGDFFGTMYELVRYYGTGIFSIFEGIRISFNASERFNQFTFIFVPVLSVLLFVLHGTENSSANPRDSVEA